LVIAIACGSVGLPAEVRAGAPAARKASTETRRQRDMKAYEAFLAGRIQESLELTRALYADFMEPIYLRNLGRCYQRLEHPDAAVYYFRDYLAKEKGLDATQIAEVEGFIQQMERLKLERELATAAPTVADTSPSPEQATTAKAARDPWDEEKTGPRAPVPKVVTKSPPADDAGLSRGAALGLASALGIAGTAAVVVGGVFGLQAKERADQSNAACSPMNVCSPDGKALRDEALRKAEVSTIAFVGGAALLGASLYFLLSAPPARRATRTARLDPRVTNQGALLLVGGEF